MNKTAYYFLPLLFFASLLAAPLKAQIPHFVFHAELSGSEAIPAVNTNGKGLVTLLFTPDRKKVTISGMLVRLDGTVTGAKIRLGKTGQTGAVLLDFLQNFDGRHILGQLDVTPELLQNLLVDGVYAEVTTTAHPNGEIRGQFVCETDLDYAMHFSGDQMVPPSGSTAHGFGGVHFPLGAEDVIYAFNMGGLTSAVTGLEIYEGLPGENGTLLKQLLKPFGSVFQALIYLDTMPPDFLVKMREGKYYMVIKTEAYPAGEMRAQINGIGYFCSVAPINGVQQVPVQFTQGFGFNQSQLSPNLDSISTRVYITDIVPTSVKIHIGNPGQVGPEFMTLDPEPTPGFYFKKYPITETQLTDFAQGRFYINVTTADKPNGEIRGFMKNTLRKAYNFDLCGFQVVPPTNSDALGVSVASVDQANCYLNFKIITDGLSSLPTDGNIHREMFGFNGPAVYSINHTEPIIDGEHEIMTSDGPVIELGGMYMQIHTTAYPDGEIRGQIKRGFTCPEVVAVSDLEQVSKVLVSPVPFRDVVNVELESVKGFEGRLAIFDLMGVRTLTQDVHIVPGKQSIQIQTAYLPKGTYTLSLEIPSQDDAILLKKMVKVE